MSTLPFTAIGRNEQSVDVELRGKSHRVTGPLDPRVLQDLARIQVSKLGNMRPSHPAVAHQGHFAELTRD